MHRTFICGILLLATTSPSPAAPPGQGQEQPLKVGLMANIFGNLDQDRAVQQVKMLAAEVEKRTGSKADFVVVPDLATLEKELKADRLQLAILHGVDYAWVRPDLPKAKPMLIAVSEKQTLQTIVLAKADQPITTLNALKGEPFILAGVTPYHVKFFLRKHVGGEPGQFFKMQETRTAEEALEAVINGKAQATAVSDSVWSLFQEMKPGRAKRLKVVAESPLFPAPVLIVRSSDAADAKIVDRFVSAMLKVHETDAGRQTLTLWRLKNFQTVPEDYAQQLEAFAKQFPIEK